jgi:YfiH family protein
MTTDGPALITSPALAAIGCPHAFTTRTGGVSSGIFASLNFGNPGELTGDARDPIPNIRANWSSVLGAIGAAGRSLVEVHQVHGANVHVVRAGEPDHPGPNDTKADAIVTDDPARVVAVRVADCAPVLLASDDGHIVAAVHAGWRGVIAGVLPAAIDAMHALGAARITAAIGPCIGPRSFEVGPEVAEQFRSSFPDHPALCAPARAPGKFLADMAGALAIQAASCGVNALTRADTCTFERPDLCFSHRRDRGLTGRMAGVIAPR